MRSLKSLAKTYTKSQFDREFNFFRTRPLWELERQKKALSVARWMNTEQEEARLAAVTKLCRDTYRRLDLHQQIRKYRPKKVQ